MYYTNEFIDGLEGSSELELDINEYAEVQAKNAAKVLMNDPWYYKQFGVYWWAVKEALKEYVHDGSWYCGGYEDSVMASRAWHGSLDRTVLAAMYYSCENPVRQNVHTWYDKGGNAHEYDLFDQDAGF